MPMAKFVVADPKTGRCYQIEADNTPLVGMKIGDVFDGKIIGLEGYKLEIRGGTDDSGFPMRPDIHGSRKVKVLLSGPPGFHPKRKGERRRKTVRGNTIAPDIVQINVKVVEYGEKSIPELLGLEENKEENKE
ncbi:Ribosomal protein S6e [Methanocaldococcus infernus ME]|uniref:Small ribosomal subunit protein eS6 n=1 Tax=Methanocaldococcus infernus (strain DSM 11812 / JCM 15783 / ME) TaxID=573063 RepID=D5VQE9_METIM|nr:30S ribosomal protein S6e [Methanocaldococcus infernus]ADG12802.1 Ribosomal protein S6e [Methanocaldococcus infernus ME]